MTKVLLFLFYSIPVWMLLYTLINREFRKYFLPLKIFCSFCFVGVSLLCALWSNGMEEYLYVFPAFFMCFMGDVFLGIFNTKKRKKYFIIGSLFFLTGHIFFISSCCKLIPLTYYDVIFPICFTIAIFLYIRKKKMHVGRLKPIIYIYSFIISLFASHSTLLWMNLKSPRTACLFLGALLFLISDVLILPLYFHRNHRWCIHGFNIATYYYGIFFLALSILYIT